MSHGRYEVFQQMRILGDDMPASLLRSWTRRAMSGCQECVEENAKIDAERARISRMHRAYGIKRRRASARK